ncbi:hypothetical protein [Paludibacterium paludis]|uniref:Uncharacterized protein n=1 Tax=Paludibacterium paludis TaxID=1225769 RepID=A0A918UAD4_9NEIS|nr:hypothetical protein [Paludibacterium paludis]GGY21125.1 hypothetical protein GCM10011289_26020 [Paludibacterium paludis]
MTVSMRAFPDGKPAPDLASALQYVFTVAPTPSHGKAAGSGAKTVQASAPVSSSPELPTLAWMASMASNERLAILDRARLIHGMAELVVTDTERRLADPMTSDVERAAWHREQDDILKTAYLLLHTLFETPGIPGTDDDRTRKTRRRQAILELMGELVILSARTMPPPRPAGV